MLYKHIKDDDIVLFVKDYPNSPVKKGMFGVKPLVDEEDGYLYLHFPEKDTHGNFICAFSPHNHVYFLKLKEDTDLEDIIDNNPEDILAVVYSPSYQF